MSETLLRCLIIFPLVFLAGAVDAVAGGGGLISLPAYLIAGLPVHLSIGTNKLSAGMGTALATFRYAKSGYIPWKPALCCSVCALAGSAAGARLALLLDDGIFKIVMLVILPLTGFLLHGSVLVPLGLAAGAFSIAGNYLGTRIFDRGGAKAIKPLILLVLTIFFIKILWEVLS